MVIFGALTLRVREKGGGVGPNCLCTLARLGGPTPSLTLLGILKHHTPIPNFLYTI